MNILKIEEKLDRIERLITANKKVLSFDEACEYTGISRSYMYKLTASRNVPHSKPSGKVIFFNKEKLDEWLLNNAIKTQEEIDEETARYSIKKKKA